MKSGSLKAADQQPVVVQMAPSVAVVSDPPLMVGTGMAICSNAKARKYTQ
jgi:hypothetical protein